jgi:hypothetical protein
LVAIVGSVDSSRTDYDPPLKNVEQADEACGQIGAALANAGYRIVVYSGDRGFIEPAVVRGYVGADHVADESVQVVYPSEIPGSEPSFDEQHQAPSKFKLQPDPSRDWEVSFFRSLFVADAVFAVGGARSSFTAGLVALSAGKAMVAVDAFGGAAAKLRLAVQRTIDHPVAEEDIALMARGEWRDDSARKLVEALTRQRTALKKRDEQRRAAESQERRRRWISAAWAAGFLIAALAGVAMALTVESPGVFWHYMLLLTIPVLTGAAGGSAHAAFRPADSDPLGRPILLGLVAGAVSALLYLAAQLFTGTGVNLGDLTSRQYQGAAWFAFIIGFIAGLTFEAVFRRLEETDVVTTSPISPT